jgi:16S rRNA (uracil1498-N3)-methyltransferase
MQLFYDEALNTQQPVSLISAEESKHILRVLRKNIGDNIHLTNGKGDAFHAEIIGVKSKCCEVKILKHFNESPLPYSLHIAIAPTKSSDRFEFFLEKATEIGISEITPLLCDNSERKRLNMKRCEKIILSGMKQSQRFHLPKLNEMQKINHWIEKGFGQYDKYIAHCEEDKKVSFTKAIKLQSKILNLIGPEGDFSSDEIKLALSRDFKAVSLGEKRLRTETAGIVTCQMVSCL